MEKLVVTSFNRLQTIHHLIRPSQGLYFMTPENRKCRNRDIDPPLYGLGLAQFIIFELMDMVAN